MKKDRFNSIFRGHVKEEISIKDKDREFISSIYQSFKDVLGDSCIQIGSYPRFTAIRPLHDLDILYVIGDWDENNHNPAEALALLEKEIKNKYKNPTEYDIEIILQTHSITVSFNKKGEEYFSVDIVPAYVFSKNEFDEDMYKVPEVVRKKSGIGRIDYYKKIKDNKLDMGWLLSDPRGYIKIASDLNNANDDFRRTVKFIKKWKSLHKEQDEYFKLKSFHIEQVVTSYFIENNDLQIFDGIFYFFKNLPDIIEKPVIQDRANSDKYIDDYLADLTDEQRKNIIQARDYFLVQLENFDKNSSLQDLLKADVYVRVSSSEEFLFDQGIMTLTDDEIKFGIHGEVQERKGGFRAYILDKIGLIVVDRRIKFMISGQRPNVDLFKWKVKNDDSSPEPRGEITDHKTKNDPEHTKYFGEHYVECYAILDNMCISKAKQNVKLN